MSDREREQREPSEPPPRPVDVKEPAETIAEETPAEEPAVAASNAAPAPVAPKSSGFGKIALLGLAALVLGNKPRRSGGGISRRAPVRAATTTRAVAAKPQAKAAVTAAKPAAKAAAKPAAKSGRR